MRPGRAPVIAWIVARLARLRFPTLFLITGALFLVTLVVPDAIPFADEILLGLGTALLGRVRKRGAPAVPDAAGGVPR
jgi:hypothetical protein